MDERTDGRTVSLQDMRRDQKLPYNISFVPLCLGSDSILRRRNTGLQWGIQPIPLHFRDPLGVTRS